MNSVNLKVEQCEKYIDDNLSGDIEWLKELSEKTIYRYVDLLIIYVRIIKRFNCLETNNLYFKMSFLDICNFSSCSNCNYRVLSNIVNDFIDVNLCDSEELKNNFNRLTNGKLNYLIN